MKTYTPTTPSSVNPWSSEHLHRALRHRGWRTEYIPYWALYELAFRDLTVIVDAGIPPSGPIGWQCHATVYHEDAPIFDQKRSCRDEIHLQQIFMTMYAPWMMTVRKWRPRSPEDLVSLIERAQLNQHTA